MSSPVHPSLEHLVTRPFSFYPPIVGIEHNEWLYRKATWSEILVVNCKTDKELWISRRFIGEVSKVDDPVLIVGLSKELEYKGGTVWPYQQRVLNMPVPTAPPVGSGDEATATPPPQPGATGTESATDLRILKLIGGVVLGAILLYLGAVNWVRVGDLRQRIKITTRDQSYLELSPRDDYYAIVQKLGRPVQDRWQTEMGAIQYQALSFPDRGYTVILMGGDRKTAFYIGTVDNNWLPVHSVPLRSGGTTFALLRELKRF